MPGSRWCSTNRHGPQNWCSRRQSTRGTQGCSRHGGTKEKHAPLARCALQPEAPSSPASCTGSAAPPPVANPSGHHCQAKPQVQALWSVRHFLLGRHQRDHGEVLELGWEDWTAGCSRTCLSCPHSLKQHHRASRWGKDCAIVVLAFARNVLVLRTEASCSKSLVAGLQVPVVALGFHAGNPALSSGTKPMLSIPPCSHPSC